jgi:hypothetical protein
MTGPEDPYFYLDACATAPLERERDLLHGQGAAGRLGQSFKPSSDRL